MKYIIRWTPDALRSFEDRIEYLEKHWTEKEKTNFHKRVNEYLYVLGDKPFIGKKFGRLLNVHIGLIIRPVSLIYRVKGNDCIIELILFIDNRQDPKKIKKFKI